MGQIILGVGDYGASNSPEDEVKTFALGSCVSVIMLDPATRTVGPCPIRRSTKRKPMKNLATLPTPPSRPCSPKWPSSAATATAKGWWSSSVVEPMLWIPMTPFRSANGMPWRSKKSFGSLAWEPSLKIWDKTSVAPFQFLSNPAR